MDGLLAFAAFGRRAFGPGAFESIMVTLAVTTTGVGIVVLIAEDVYALLVPVVDLMFRLGSCPDG